MKLDHAVGIAEECGLTTIGEAVYNIRIHSGNLFRYEDISHELEELYKDVGQINFEMTLSDYRSLKGGN